MGYIKGFTLGLFTGFAIGVALNDRQRREVADRVAAVARDRTRPVVDAVSANAAKVADAATDAVVTAVDGAGDAVSEQIAPEEVAAP